MIQNVLLLDNNFKIIGKQRKGNFILFKDIEFGKLRVTTSKY